MPMRVKPKIAVFQKKMYNVENRVKGGVPVFEKLSKCMNFSIVYPITLQGV